jgi:hypothetical protein
MHFSGWTHDGDGVDKRIEVESRQVRIICTNVHIFW